MDFSWVFSSGIKFALELRAFLMKYGEIQKSKKQFFNAINDDIIRFEKSWEYMNNYTNDVRTLLDEIEISPSADQVQRSLELFANSFTLYSGFTNAYVRYSITVRDFSINNYMMTNLRNYKGILADYVDQISETVQEDNTIKIDGRLITFFKANKDEFMMILDESESQEVQEETEKIINDIKHKLLPSIVNEKPRFIFRPKRISRIFKEPILQFLEDRKKIIFDIPNQEQIDFVASTNMPIFYVMDELTAIENRANNRRLERLR